MRIAPYLLVCLALALACSRSEEAREPEPDREAAPPAVRARLFDGLQSAVMRGAELASASPRDAAPPARWRYDFDAEHPAGVWFARLDVRRLDWQTDGFTAGEGAPGREGNGLRLGPGVPEDLSRASLLFPAGGRSRVKVSARVRLEGNPESGNASSREVLRVVDLRDAATEPTSSRLRRRTAARVSRQIDPSGWDRVVAEVVTESDCAGVELQLLHRTGGSTDAATTFDDVEVEVAPLDEAGLLAFLVEQHRPRDGQGGRASRRLRVDLEGQVRDAALILCGGELGFDVRVPAAETEPRLRFHAGALSESSRVEGDGSRMVVRFRGPEGEVDLGSVELDPKSNRGDRRWRPVELELGKVAGRSGTLAFAVEDVDSEPDELDALLLATPRIEPGAEPSDDVRTAFNVLLIGVDTLRADRMSAFGYERETTPRLKALADEGVRFSKTRSQAPWTLPSFSSILTSLYPSSHGAGRGGHDEWEAIDPTTLALPEVLARNGYETAGIIANPLISPRYGLDQGFDSYRTAWSMESAARDAGEVAEFVEGHRRTPWMLFWHIMDPHLPYATEAEARAAFTDPGYRGRFGGSEPNVPFQVLDPRPGRRWFTHEGPPPLPDLSPEDARFVSDYYDAEIFEVDAAVGRVLDALRASGQWERTIVALVADHGEGLADHGHYHHGYTLYDDQVHIPMILRIPGAHAGRVIDRPVAAIDLAPTILGALGIRVPPEFQGVDRLAPDAPSGDAFFIEYPTYDSSAQKAWVEGRFKYMHDPVFHTEHLFDVVADPGERENVASAHPDVVARARKALDAFRVEHIDTGRFHLRVQGKAGQRLRVRVATDDLFDANFVTRPAVDERELEMDLDRSYLELETTLVDGRIELVFWCRGARLDVEATLDDAPLEGLELDPGAPSRAVPAALARHEILERRGADDRWPRAGRASLWLEAGAGEATPIVNTPEEIERLRELGYAH